MANTIRSHHFQHNYDYFPQNQKKASNEFNIYIGGTKKKCPQKNPQRKGISLTKSLSMCTKLSNRNYFQQPMLKTYPNKIIEKKQIPLILKPNFPITLSKTVLNTNQLTNRSYSSPLLFKFRNHYPTAFINQCFRQKKAIQKTIQKTIKPEKQYVLMQPAKCIASCSSVDYYTHPLQHSISSGNLLHNAKFLLQSKEKVMIASPSSKVTFSSVFIPRTVKVQGNILSDKKSSQNNIYKNPNIYLQTLSTYPSHNHIKHKFYHSPNKIRNNNTGVSPLPTEIEILRLRGLNLQNNQKPNHKQVYFPSLKHSKSTAEQRQSPFTEYQTSLEEQRPKFRQNDQTSIQKRKSNNSVKSLWDSIDKCAVSLICQNSQIKTQNQVQTAFSQNGHKTYNQLGQVRQFNQILVQRFPVELNDQNGEL